MDDEPKGCGGCIHRHWVRAHPWGMSASGWGCRHTGGHAIKRCPAYQAEPDEKGGKHGS